MPGVPIRSGGSNRLTPQGHRLRGTFRPSRHAGRTNPLPEAVSPAERRRTLEGLGPDARRIVSALLRVYSGWDAASLTALRSYALSCERLHLLEQTPTSDTRGLHREIRANLALLKSLNLEIAR